MPLKRKTLKSSPDEDNNDNTSNQALSHNLKKTKKTLKGNNNTNSSKIINNKAFINDIQDVPPQSIPTENPLETTDATQIKQQVLLSESKSLAMTDKKIWIVCYNGIEVRYQITPDCEISTLHNTINAMFFAPNQLELSFFDKNGIPIHLSHDIPSNTKLYMRATPPIIPRWTWLIPQNPETHKRQNNNLTICSDLEKGKTSYCFGAFIMKTGQHYFTLLIQPLGKYVKAGIEAAGGYGKKNPSLKFLSSLKLKELFKNEPSLENSPESTYEVGFFVDMEQKILKVTNHPMQKVLTTRSFTWDFVRPVIAFRGPALITITNPELPIPTWIQETN